MAPNGKLIEEITYLKVSAYNLSYGRLPDGSGHLAYGLWPTPNEPNLLYEESFIPVTGQIPELCPIPGEIRTYLMRHLRHPARTRWMKEHGYRICEEKVEPLIERPSENPFASLPKLIHR
jgi:hypothetical protein